VIIGQLMSVAGKFQLSSHCIMTGVASWTYCNLMIIYWGAHIEVLIKFLEAIP